MIIVSFIIPAYNASSTIVRCLDSIYALGLNSDEFEVIVVDDCSSDNTVDVIRDYCQNHLNITLLLQDHNQRQGAARNRALEFAKGEYVSFLDSDDEVCPGLLDAVRLAESQSLELVAINYQTVDADRNYHLKQKEPLKIGPVFSGVEFQTIYPYWGTAPWPYLYRRSFIEQVGYPFREGVIFEDSDFVAIHLFHTTRMGYVDAISYRMYFNPTSTTHTLTYKHVADYYLLGRRMLEFYESLPEKSSKYSASILEGGSYNVWIAFKGIRRLSSLSEVSQFYKRIDTAYKRSDLLSYYEPSYCWTGWTRLCLRSRIAAIILTVPYLYTRRLVKSF